MGEALDRVSAAIIGSQSDVPQAYDCLIASVLELREAEVALAQAKLVV